MTTFHDAYPSPPVPVLVPFEGDRTDLRGGEYLGSTARPELFEAGDMIAFTSNGYYYDPLMLITEHHTYVAVKNPNSKDTGIEKTWIRVDRDYVPFSFKFAQDQLSKS